MTNHSKNKSVDITFYPFKGIGQVLFTSQEKDVLNLLGEPFRKEEIIDDECRVVIYYYDSDPHIDCLFHYENDAFGHLSVFTANIVLDGFDFASAAKDKLVDFIKEYHKKHGIEFKFEVSRAEDVNEDYFQFDNLGLTIWYSGEYVSEICVQLPL